MVVATVTVIIEWVTGIAATIMAAPVSSRAGNPAERLCSKQSVIRNQFRLGMHGIGVHDPGRLRYGKFWIERNLRKEGLKAVSIIDFDLKGQSRTRIEICLRQRTFIDSDGKTPMVDVDSGKIRGADEL
ncbi:MAG: hypothetical protein P4M08_06675 [Oligoflexia bacterium]|nr:hypothetical protein [Oligoflexia bacterium]